MENNNSEATQYISIAAFLPYQYYNNLEYFTLWYSQQ